MTTEEILYKQFRNIPPLRLKEYQDWLHKKFPDKEIHHLTGSMGSLKLHDCFSLPTTRKEHTEYHNGNTQQVFIDNIAYSIRLFLQFLQETNRL